MRYLEKGGTVEFGGMEWVVLDFESQGNITKLLAQGFVSTQAFDKRGYNNWTKSTVREYLNKTFLEKLLENGVALDMLASERRDLTSLDGKKDYGERDKRDYGTCRDFVGLLTLDEYRKYRDVIPEINFNWWLMTPYSIGSENVNHVVLTIKNMEKIDPLVLTIKRMDGIVGFTLADSNDYVVRPTMNVYTAFLKYEKTDLEYYTNGMTFTGTQEEAMKMLREELLKGQRLNKESH